jgi:hypothetical protein
MVAISVASVVRKCRSTMLTVCGEIGVVVNREIVGVNH